MLDLLFTIDLAERHMKHVFDPAEPATRRPERGKGRMPTSAPDRVAARPRLPRLARTAVAGARGGR